jgi:hypothetical protein
VDDAMRAGKDVQSRLHHLELLLRRLESWVLNPAGSNTYTAVTVGSGVTYAVKVTDAVISFDSSLTTQAQPVATLANGTFVGEQHTFIWYGWGNQNTPPLVQGRTVGVLMMPYAGMQASGIGGLVNSSDINQQGGFYTLRWTGAFWAQVG